MHIPQMYTSEQIAQFYPLFLIGIWVELLQCRLFSKEDHEIRMHPVAVGSMCRRHNLDHRPLNECSHGRSCFTKVSKNSIL